MIRCLLFWSLLLFSSRVLLFWTQFSWIPDFWFYIIFPQQVWFLLLWDIFDLWGWTAGGWCLVLRLRCCLGVSLPLLSYFLDYSMNLCFCWVFDGSHLPQLPCFWLFFFGLLLLYLLCFFPAFARSYPWLHIDQGLVLLPNTTRCQTFGHILFPCYIIASPLTQILSNFVACRMCSKITCSVYTRCWA